LASKTKKKRKKNNSEPAKSIRKKKEKEQEAPWPYHLQFPRSRQCCPAADDAVSMQKQKASTYKAETFSPSDVASGWIQEETHKTITRPQSVHLPY
jgi:hypothetical protein